MVTSHLSELLTCFPSLFRQEGSYRHLCPGRAWFMKLKPIDNQAREDSLLDKRIYSTVLYILFHRLPWDMCSKGIYLSTVAVGGCGSSKYALDYISIWTPLKKLYRFPFTGVSGCSILGEWRFKLFESFYPWISLSFLHKLGAGTYDCWQYWTLAAQVTLIPQGQPQWFAELCSA